ncbi:MAG: T9SS type A sorting domain-containing protein [candidate division WOR-3 bacterium]|nr:T9SS type A sorting domain-containing protein [candidate division WOR-3 bacterium]
MLLLSTVSLDAVGVSPVTSGLPSGKWREPCSPLRTLLPSVGVHDTGLLTVAIDDIGGQEGWKLTYFWPDTTSVGHLFWNWLAVGLSPQSVADAWDFDWYTTTGGSLVILEPGPFADEEGLAEFADMSGRVRVKQHSYAWGAEPDEDYIIVDYTIVNMSGVQQDSVYVSHRTDFDVLGDHGMAMTDKSGFDSTRTLAYMWDSSATVHAGVSILSGTFHGYHTGWHIEGDSDKYSVMDLPGADPTTPSWDDWCIWLSAGPYQVPAGDSIDVVFAFLMGESLEDLQANADAAQAKWQQLSLSGSESAAPAYRPTTTFCRSAVTFGGAHRAVLTDASGRKVMQLLPGTNDVSRLPAGVYFVSQTSGVGREASSVTKLILTR